MPKLTRQRKEQLKRKTNGICEVGGCLGLIDPISKCYCEYHLNRASEKRTNKRNYAKTEIRLKAEQARLDEFLLQKAGFKTRQEALDTMVILEHLTARLKNA